MHLLFCPLIAIYCFCLAKRSRALLASNPTRDSQSAPEVSGQSPQGGRPGDLVDNVVRPWPFGRPSWLEVKLMKRVIHRRNSYLDNTGHWQCSVALVVPLARVSARLRKEPTGTFGKSLPHPREHQSRPEMGSRARGCPERSQALPGCVRSTALVPDSRVSQLTHDVQGSSRPLLGMSIGSESKRRRWSANKGTREARLSRVVTQRSRSSDRPKHLPMRQSSGGAPVVVGGRESRPQGEGVQDDSCLDNGSVR
jgi:hypothetical protein